MKPKDIELHIEEIVLDGLVQVDQQRFGRAVQQELSQLLTQQGMPRSLKRDGAVSQLNGGKFEVAPGATEGVIAGQVARAVYKGLGE